MLFTSYEFIGFVLITFLLYYIVPKKIQWVVLLLSSYVFYALADIRYVPYILATTLITYLSGIAIQKHADKSKEYLNEHKEDFDKEAKKAYKNAAKRIRIRYAAVAVILVVGILSFVKYTNFILSGVNAVLQVFNPAGQFALLDLLVPMGISFYTFMAVSYVVDVYRGTTVAERNFFKYALFISFFPHIVQGPISRFKDMSESLFEEHRFCMKTFSYGITRVLWGFFKKLVVADRIVTAVTTVIGAKDGEYRGVYALLGIIFYTIELYADFTGGIDITIGIAQAMGISVKENFIRPYFAKSLKEYWRRWHITMCEWFRDYIFYPVSGSKWMNRLTKTCRKCFGEKIGRRIPVYVASFIVWFTTGLWHGASLNFIVWGLLNYVVLMISEECEPLYDKFHARFNVQGKTWYKVFQIGRTFILICVLNLFDCFTNIGDTLHMLSGVFTVHNYGELFTGGLLTLGLTIADYVVLVVAIVIMIAVSMAGRAESVRDRLQEQKFPVRATLIALLFISIIVFGAYGIGYDAGQFIYNKF